MESIRINELARELEVKSKAVLDYLSEIGVTDKKSHSSALEDEVAEKVRAHFRALNQEAAEEEPATGRKRSEEHTSELQSRLHLVCRLLLEKKKKNIKPSSLSS